MSSLDPSDLSRVALFAGLDVPDQRVVATWLDVGEFEPGYKMTHEGASGYAFFVLHAGAADVVVGGNVVRTLGPGDFFGELSMLGDGRQTATVTVTRPSTIWTMSGCISGSPPGMLTMGAPHSSMALKQSSGVRFLRRMWPGY